MPSMTIVLKPETVALVKKSNELAQIVRELEEKNKAYWDRYRQAADRSLEIELKVLAGDRSLLEQWVEERRTVRTFIASDDESQTLSKARMDYHKAYDAAAAALRTDAGLTWNAAG